MVILNNISKVKPYCFYISPNHCTGIDEPSFKFLQKSKTDNFLCYHHPVLYNSLGIGLVRMLSSSFVNIRLDSSGGYKPVAQCISVDSE
jgi:hypothetical protein